MSTIKLEAFKTALIDICRPNRFFVSINYNDSNFNEEDFWFVKSCSIPDKVLGEIELGWQGYKYKVAGDVIFNDVNITFHNCILHDGTTLRDKFERWMMLISHDNKNIKTAHFDYKGTVNIQQVDGTGKIIATYTLEHAHPKELSAVELSMDSTDSTEEFSVTFSFSFFNSRLNFEASPYETSGESRSSLTRY